MAKVRRKARHSSKKKSLRKALAAGLQEQITRDRKRASQGKQYSLVKSGIPLWKVTPGDHTIDILPYLAGNHHPDVSKGRSTYRFEYSLHRDIGPKKQKLLCLESIGAGRCPVCEHQAQLIEDGADESKWKPLKAKPWVLFNVICYDKGEEKKGVQVWDSPYFWSLENIMDIAKVRGRGGQQGKTIDFAHPDTGKSISFTVKAAKGPNDYQKYKGFKFEDRDYEISDELLEGCFVLDELIPIPTEEEVEEILFGSSLRKKGIKKVKEDEDEDILSSIDDMDAEELQDFCEEHDLDVNIRIPIKKNKLKKAKALVKSAYQEKYEDEEEEVEDDEEPDDEEEDTEPDDEDEEDEEDEDEIKGLTSEDVENMSFKELKKICKVHDLETDPDDFDDAAELAEAIIEEMELI